MTLWPLSAHHLCMSFRIYIDESGDHSYRGLNNPGRRYLGLTGVVFRKAEYDPAIPLGLEALKRRHFLVDIDYPLVLHRRDVMEKRTNYWVLRDPRKNRAWEDDLIDFLRRCPMHVFTAVVDKRARIENYGDATTNPYALALADVLERVGFWLTSQKDGTADVMLESRESKNDSALVEANTQLRIRGSRALSPEQFTAVFLGESLLFRSKEHNVAGLQIADMLVADQKRLTVEESIGLADSNVGPFGRRVNSAVAEKVDSQIGRRLLQ